MVDSRVVFSGPILIQAATQGLLGWALLRVLGTRVSLVNPPPPPPPPKKKNRIPAHPHPPNTWRQLEERCTPA